LGYWSEKVKIGNIHLIPALIGALAGAFIVPATAKALAKIFGARETGFAIGEERKAA
jgi:hypothetical protein